MKLLLDICHPAHVHFFKHPIQQLTEQGVSILVTSRRKECTQALLDSLNIEHLPIYSRDANSVYAFGKELVLRNKALYQIVKSWRPDLMAGIGGIFIAQVSRLSGVPAIVFYDGDNALMQNVLTYPFASQVIVPKCYQGWTPKQTMRYSGFHELSYMHPDIFKPNYGLAVRAGLCPDKPNYLIRLVAWHASHDIGHQGFNLDTLLKLVERLSQHANVIISSEMPLPRGLAAYAYQGPVELLHHVMAYCKGFIGESPTMAIEAAICGVPGLFVSSLQCGNIISMSQDYQMIKQINIRHGDCLFEGLDWLLNLSEQERQQRLTKLLNQTVKVSDFVTQILVGG